MYYTDLEANSINSSMNLIPVIDKLETSYDYVTNDGPITYLLTQKSAPNFRLVAIDIRNPKEVSFKFLFIFLSRIILIRGSFNWGLDPSK